MLYRFLFSVSGRRGGVARRANFTHSGGGRGRGVNHRKRASLYIPSNQIQAPCRLYHIIEKTGGGPVFFCLFFSSDSGRGACSQVLKRGKNNIQKNYSSRQSDGAGRGFRVKIYGRQGQAIQGVRGANKGQSGQFFSGAK